MSFILDRPSNTSIPRGFPSNVRTLNELDHIFLPRLKQRSLPKLRGALRTLIQGQLEQPIRHVIGYDEHTVRGGGCTTCDFEFTVFDVYFKDSSGRTLVWRYQGELREIIQKLVAVTPQD